MKFLIVTFENDLGSRTLGNSLLHVFEGNVDLKIHRFAAVESQLIDGSVNNKRSLINRIADTHNLRKVVADAIKEKRIILFQHVSPALFSYGIWKNGQTFITTDWTRRLNQKRRSSYSYKRLIETLQDHIIRKATGLLPITTALKNCFVNSHGADPTKVRLVKFPVDTNRYTFSDIKLGNPPRLLFIAGDFKGKAGDLLLEAYQSKFKARSSLTIVTSYPLPEQSGVRVIRNLRYNDPKHPKIFHDHDMLIHPTWRDAGPQVVAEAVASGLAVGTTIHAKGAPDWIKTGKNGIISNSPEKLFEEIDILLNFPERIQKMREESCVFIKENYLNDAIFRSYQEAILDILKER